MLSSWILLNYPPKGKSRPARGGSVLRDWNLYADITAGGILCLVLFLIWIKRCNLRVNYSKHNGLCSCLFGLH